MLNRTMATTDGVVKLVIQGDAYWLTIYQESYTEDGVYHPAQSVTIATKNKIKQLAKFINKEIGRANRTKPERDAHDKEFGWFPQQKKEMAL